MSWPDAIQVQHGTAMPDELSGQAPNMGELHSSVSRGWLVDRLRAYWARDDSRHKGRKPPLRKAETITIGVILPAPEQTADGSVQGIERRLVYRIMRYWQKQCGGRQYPSLSDIDPEAIADMWPSCFLRAHEQRRRVLRRGRHRRSAA